MSKIFITGSSDGLGQMAAKLLINEGYQVVLHARNAERGRQGLSKVPRAEKVLTADLSNIEEVKTLAAEVNALGRFDAIIHNAGVYQVANKLIFAVNSLAPYVLTCLIQRPKRLIYLCSGMHWQGDASLKNLSHNSGSCNYSDSKLQVLILSMAVARKWPEVFANAVDPGWVPTKMGGSSAPDDMEQAHLTQAWLAAGEDPKTQVTGKYFYHMRRREPNPQAHDPGLQDRLIAICVEISGVTI
jgi:NAD(P)-dependent dehydrogenase (short-subunit alcohol dehydrogenase family)